MDVAGRTDAIGTEQNVDHPAMHSHARIASDTSVGAVRNWAGRRSRPRYSRQVAGPRIVVDVAARYSGSSLREQPVLQDCTPTSGYRRRIVRSGRRSASRSVYRGNRLGASGWQGNRGLREGLWKSSERQGRRGFNRLRCGFGWTNQDYQTSVRHIGCGCVVRFRTQPGFRTNASGVCRDWITQTGRTTGFRGGSTSRLQKADRIGKVELR